jgi:hypothetical protein
MSKHATPVTTEVTYTDMDIINEAVERNTTVDPRPRNNKTNKTNNTNITKDLAHPRPWNAKHLPQVPTPTYASIANKTAPPSTNRPKQSYSAIAQKLAANKPAANVEAAKSALAFFHQKRIPHQSSTEQRLGLRRIYVNGIPRTSYKELKSRLFSLHFMLTKIVNISYIAQNCVEFVVQEDYTTSFLAKCKTFRFQVIEADPTKPLDPKYPVEKLEEVKALFARRVANIIQNTKLPSVKEFYTLYAAELDIPLPIPDTIMASS